MQEKIKFNDDKIRELTKTIIKNELCKIENKEFLTNDETAEILGIHKQGLSVFQKATGVKAYTLTIKAVFYDKKDILEFVKQKGL